MRHAERAALVVVAVVGLTGAEPAAATRFDIAPGSLGAVAAALGARAGISVGVADPGLAARASPGVRGDLSVAAALRRALRGTGAAVVRIDDAAVAIVAARPARSYAAARPRAITLSRPLDDGLASEIVVTASKQGTRLDRYPGSAEVLDLAGDRLATTGTGDTAAIVARLPTLASTSLGPGRDKLFIRGVADSSFNGPSQATIGQYLGEARLTYNAPDPDLNLYDMQRVEVLVGPQGTLYGSGSLGGILRLIPNAPDPAGFAATFSAGASAVRHGGNGSDVAAMVNLPIGNGAVRGVGYWHDEPGYIDDPGRKLTDINRTKSFGGRLAVRLDDVAGWRVEIGGAFQDIGSRDGQYTLRGQPPLIRRSAFAQPFDNDFRIAFLEARRDLDWADIVSTTSVVRHDLATVFDATQGSTPARFIEDIGITLLSHETRATGGSSRAPWLVGVSAVYDISRLSRTLGPLDRPVPIAGVRNENSEFAAFGRYGFPLLPGVTATLGGRVTFARSNGMLLGAADEETAEPHGDEIRISPTAALSWAISPSFFAFAHYQEGFRAGGLAVAPSGSPAESRRFEPDNLTMMEAGIRRAPTAAHRLSFGATLSYVKWSEIQADLVDAAGLPFTANIGTGRIFGVEAKIGWYPVASLHLEAAAFANRSTLYRPSAEFLTADERSLPNIAEEGGRVAATWQTRLADRHDLTIDASLRYIGRSQLGIGAPLDVPQGDYLVAALGGRLVLGRYGVSLDIANAADARANRFAFGNPFGLAARDQMTPLRPRSVRIGLDARF